MSGMTDPWQVITDVTSELIRGGQTAGIRCQAALGVLERAGIDFDGNPVAAAAQQQPQPAPERAAAMAETPECEFRDELTELTERHDSLLHAILPASSDPCDGDEDGDDLAVRYVRDLEAERDRLRLLVRDSEPLTVKPADDVQPAPELAAAASESEADEIRAVIDMIWRMCERASGASQGAVAGGEGLAARITGLIGNSGMEPF